MIQNPRAFFSQEQKLEIDAAVKKAEKATSGEIVPVLAGRADDYSQGPYHAAITLTILATLALFGVHLAVHGDMGWSLWAIPVYVILPVQLAALLASYHLARNNGSLHRAFLPQALMEKRVETAARRAFHDLGLAGTKGGTGIMLYVSIFERVAIVVADKAIANKCTQQTWDGVRDLLIAGLKKNDGVRGFTDAIGECGRILAKEFPPSAENPDELTNELRIIP